MTDIAHGKPIDSTIAPPATGPTMDPSPCAQLIIPAIIPYVCILSPSYPVALNVHYRFYDMRYICDTYKI